MADDTSNLINIDRLQTFDVNLKNYIDTNSQASELLDEVVLLIEDNIHNGKAVIAESVTNKGVPTTSDQGFSEIAANIDSIKTASGNATANQVLEGATFTNDSGSELTGTMANNDAINGTVNCGDSYTIPAGFTTGGKVIANSLASQTSATATAVDILKDKTAWVGGTKLTGTMANNGALGATLNCGEDYTIPAGFTTGGTVTANSLASQTAATAAAAQILSGKTAWVNGSLVTGSITSKAAATYTPTTTAQTIGKGVYLSGDQTIAGDANLVSGNIKSGVSIFGVSGNSNVVDTSAGTATAAQILSGKIAFVDGAKVTGTMANNGALGTTLGINGSYTIPAGYTTGGTVTQSITTKAAATYTPGTSNQTISAGQYLSGAQTIAGSANLVASNIKSGVKIFNVTGNLNTSSDIIKQSTLSGTVIKTHSWSVSSSWSHTITLNTSSILYLNLQLGIYESNTAMTSSSASGAVQAFYYNNIPSGLNTFVTSLNGSPVTSSANFNYSMVVDYSNDPYKLSATNHTCTISLSGKSLTIGWTCNHPGSQYVTPTITDTIKIIKFDYYYYG